MLIAPVRVHRRPHHLPVKVVQGPVRDVECGVVPLIERGHGDLRRNGDQPACVTRVARTPLAELRILQRDVHCGVQRVFCGVRRACRCGYHARHLCRLTKKQTPRRRFGAYPARTTRLEGLPEARSGAALHPAAGDRADPGYTTRAVGPMSSVAPTALAEGRDTMRRMASNKACAVGSSVSANCW